MTRVEIKRESEQLFGSPIIISHPLSTTSVQTPLPTTSIQTSLPQDSTSEAQPSSTTSSVQTLPRQDSTSEKKKKLPPFTKASTSENQSTVSANQSQQPDSVSPPHDTASEPVSGNGVNTSKTAPSVTKSPAILSTPVTISNPTQSHDSASSSPTVPIGVLIGAVLAAVVLSTGAALFVWYFRVRRGRRVARLAQQMSTNTGNGVPSPRLLPENMASVEFIAERRPIAKGSHRNPATAPSSASQWSMDHTPGQRGNGNTGRRAVDAGPVADNAEDEEDDVESTLPPEYTDVFAMSRSSVVSSRS